MRRLGAAQRRHPHPRGEAARWLHRRVEERALGLVAGDHRRPGDVDAAGRVGGQRRAVVGAAVDRPAVLADPRRWRERGAAVARHGEGDVAQVAGVDMTPRRHQALAVERDDRRLAAIADARGDLAVGRATRPERGVTQARSLRHRHAVVLALVLMLARLRPAISVTGFGEAAVIEPQHVRRALVVESQRVPAAVAGRAGRLQRHRRAEAAPAVGGSRQLDLGPPILGVPRHDDVGLAGTGARVQRDARRDLAADAAVASHAVHLDWRTEGRALVAARRHVDVRAGAGGRGPGHRHEAAMRGDPRRRVGSSGHGQRDRRQALESRAAGRPAPSAPLPPAAITPCRLRFMSHLPGSWSLVPWSLLLRTAAAAPAASCAGRPLPRPGRRSATDWSDTRRRRSWCCAPSRSRCWSG